MNRLKWFIYGMANGFALTATVTICVSLLNSFIDSLSNNTGMFDFFIENFGEMVSLIILYGVGAGFIIGIVLALIGVNQSPFSK